MRVIITGGTGLIGRTLAEQMSAEGHEVIVLSRNPSRAKGFSPGVRLVAWDARTSEGWSQSVEGADAIVNLAGAGLADWLWTKSRKQILVESRIKAGEAVSEAVAKAENKPRVVIQASAIGYYGPQGEQPIKESQAPGDDFLAELCQKWEASSRPVEEQGVRRVIIRTGLVLSRNGGVLPRLLLPIRFFVGGPLGSGEQYYAWIHLQDQVRAIRFLIEDETTRGAFNLTAPNPLPNADFMETLSRSFGRPSWLPVPEFAMRLLIGDMATVVVDGQRAVPAKLEQAGFNFNYSSLEEAMQELSG
jgi:uncharacterized protein (TIGR01777 family)